MIELLIAWGMCALIMLGFISWQVKQTTFAQQELRSTTAEILADNIIKTLQLNLTEVWKGAAAIYLQPDTAKSVQYAVACMEPQSGCSSVAEAVNTIRYLQRVIAQALPNGEAKICFDYPLERNNFACNDIPHVTELGMQFVVKVQWQEQNYTPSIYAVDTILPFHPWAQLCKVNNNVAAVDYAQQVVNAVVGSTPLYPIVGSYGIHMRQNNAVSSVVDKLHLDPNVSLNATMANAICSTICTYESADQKLIDNINLTNLCDCNSKEARYFNCISGN